MGHMVETCARKRGHEIVCRIEPTPTLLEGKEIYAPEEGFQSEAFRSADVAIEFTTPATAEANIRKAWEQNVPVVSGSTGWNPEQLKNKNYNLKIKDNKTIISDETGKTMLVWSSNFSVGVNVFFELNKFLAEQLQAQVQYTPSITETHHIHKLDKPSGTAKTLAEGLRVMGYGVQDSEIESIREGEVPGTHEVKWDSDEDTIIITHIAKGREGFALGAVLAAEELKGYGLQVTGYRLQVIGYSENEIIQG